MSKYYYIYSRQFLITLGGIILMTFGVVETPTMASGGLSPVAVEFAGQPTKEAISYGHLPRVSNLSQRSISAWIYLDTSVPGGANTNIIAGMFTDTGGAAFYIGVAENDRFRLGQGYSVARGNWQTGAGTIPTGQWVHVLATLDASSSSNDPVLYINGVSTSFTENLTPSGSQADETGIPFRLGNVKTPTRDYVDGFDGKIEDVRVYSGILNSADALEMYNAGPYAYVVLDGLVFQGIHINSDLGDGTSLDGQVIPTGNNYLENIFRNVGEPFGSPLIRTP